MRIDLKRRRPDLYRPPTDRFVEVVVPPITFLAMDGSGDPNGSVRYEEALGSLYASAYAVRAAFKERTGDDFVVGPLEGLWSAQDPSAFVEGRRDEWEWTMMIPLPDEITDEDVARGLAAAAHRKPALPIDEVRLFPFEEGRSLQTMHIGSYADEGPALARLHHEVMPSMELTFNGRHHEIYLGDPRRVAPERLKTVLRHPVRPI